MKIIHFKSENFKRIKVVEFSPNGNTVIISGKNAQGKSSILDAIWSVFKWSAVSKEIPKPIRDGETHASVILELDDCIVTRTWTSNDKSTLKIESKENGVVFKSPQAMLDNIVGKLSFDPLLFSQMGAKEQKDVLLNLIDLDIDLDALEEEKKETYGLRTLINRNQRDLEGKQKTIPFPSPTLPNEEISLSDLMGEYKDATDEVNSNNEARKELIKLNEYSNSVSLKISQIKNQIADLKEQLDIQYEVSMEYDDLVLLQSELVQSIVDPDVEMLKCKLDDVDEQNKLIRNAISWRQLKTDIEAKKHKSQELTNKLEEIEITKKTAIESSNMPVEGLSFDDDGVLFNGRPFVQCSSAERVKISLGIAMALNPKLKVIRIPDGSLLDSESMKMVESMAIENDYQVWIEYVSDSGKVGVYIDDGEIVCDNYKTLSN